MNKLDNSQQYEKMLISNCLKSTENFLTCKTSGISSKDFNHPSYREIWNRMEECALTQGISPLIVVDKFENKTPEQRAERLRALEKLETYEISETDFYYAIRQTKECTAIRALKKLSEHISTSIDGNKGQEEIQSDIMNMLFNIGSADDNIKEYNSAAALKETGKEIGERRNGNIVDGIVSGIKTLDRQIKCFYFALYSIIIGRPGHGKTTLMINCFLNNIKENVKPVFFSLEMPAVHLVIKLLAIWTRIEANKIMNPKLLTDIELNSLRQALSDLSKHEFYIVDAVSMSVTQFGMLLEKYIRLGCKIAYLDYFQLLKMPNGNMPNDASDFRNLSKTVREIIRRVNRHGEMALVLGAQAGRSVEDRPVEDRIPTQKDLEWSGSLEQDAAVIIGIMNREKYEFEDCEYKNQVFLGFPKHRYNHALKVNLAFLPSIQYMTDLAHPEYTETKADRWKDEIDTKERKRKNNRDENNTKKE